MYYFESLVLLQTHFSPCGSADVNVVSIVWNHTIKMLPFYTVLLFVSCRTLEWQCHGGCMDFTFGTMEFRF